MIDHLVDLILDLDACSHSFENHFIFLQHLRRIPAGLSFVDFLSALPVSRLQLIIAHLQS
jgi:hypothetical protein